MSWLALIAVGVVLIIGVLRLRRAGAWAALRQGDPNGPTSRRRRRRSGWATIAAMLALGGWFIFVGTNLVQTQRSGVPARIKVERCSHNSRRLTGCSGQWQPVGQTQKKWVSISDADDKDVGHDIDVHIKGNRAIPDSSIEPTAVLGLGCALAVAALIAPVVFIVRRLLRGPT
jgi:hypothetical protein